MTIPEWTFVFVPLNSDLLLATNVAGGWRLVYPKTGLVNNETLGYFMARTQPCMEKTGMNPECLRFRQHSATEMARYAAGCWDPHNRTDWNHGLVRKIQRLSELRRRGYKDAAHRGPLGAGLPDVSNDRWPVIDVVGQNATDEVLESPDRFQRRGPVDREDMLLCGPGPL